MASLEIPKSKGSRPLSRKSIAHIPSTDTVSMENNTVDAAGLAPPGKGAPKKSRSKSIGLGGLDALNEISGNRGEVCRTSGLMIHFLTVISLGGGSHLRQVYFEALNSPVISQADTTSYESAWEICVSTETVSSSKPPEAEAQCARGFLD